MVALAVVALVVAELQQVVGLQQVVELRQVVGLRQVAGLRQVVGLQQVAGLIVGLVYLSQMMGLLLQLKWACW